MNKRGWRKARFVLKGMVSARCCWYSWGFKSLFWHVHDVAAHAVADSYEWTGHLLAEVVDHQEQVPRMIHPGACVWRRDDGSLELASFGRQDGCFGGLGYIQSMLSLSSFKTPLVFILAQSATQMLRIWKLVAWFSSSSQSGSYNS